MNLIFVAIAGFIAVGFVDGRPKLQLLLTGIVVGLLIAGMWVTR